MANKRIIILLYIDPIGYANSSPVFRLLWANLFVCAKIAVRCGGWGPIFGSETGVHVTHRVAPPLYICN